MEYMRGHGKINPRYATPYKQGFFLWLILCAVIFAALEWYLEAPLSVLLLSALNLGTFILYGFDKLSAMHQGRRVPEYILYVAAFAGGALGALLGMHLFRHKTRKTSFQFGLALVLLIEILIVSYSIQI